MLRVESKINDKGIVLVRLLDGKTMVAYAAFPVTLLFEMGAALMMTREKLEADGIIKPNPIDYQAPGSETWN